MSRRTRPENRCLACYMRSDLCFCRLIEPVAIATKVVVVMHRFEEHKPTSTVRLMKRVLPGTEVHLFGGRDDHLELDSLKNPPGSQLLLFPSDSASVLTADFAATLSPPLTLVIPDGTWHQAKRLANNRRLCLRDIPKVRIPDGPPSQYRVRKNKAGEGLCTLEALARALGVLEGPEIQEHLEKSLAMLVDRVMWSRSTSAAFPLSSVHSGASAPDQLD